MHEKDEIRIEDISVPVTETLDVVNDLKRTEYIVFAKWASCQNLEMVQNVQVKVKFSDTVHST